MYECQDQATSTSTTALDPSKHVKYNLGMVLGIDDFNQEFAYLSNRDQWLARDLVGYGTACGLHVSIETDKQGPRVAVAPGVAVNPRGRLIRVTSAQCAYLNDWLAAHRGEVLDEAGSPPGTSITLYVVLCQNECPTDPVPIPGEPCRDEADLTAASRIKDDFKLELTFHPPDQTEEDALRDFVQWLSQVEISESAPSVPLDQFIAAIREAAFLLASPPSSPPDFMVGSPPSALQINAADACQYLRAAFRVWVTELRGQWRGKSCEASIPVEKCVLLAAVHVPLVDGQAGSMSDADVDEERRPYLIHMRMLQEWLMCGRGMPTPGDTVMDETAFGQPSSAGVSPSYSRADHTHGTPDLPPIPQPSRPESLKEERTFNLPANLGALTDQFALADHTHGTPDLTGDVTINAASERAVVGGIGQIPLDLANLDDGQVLVYNKTQNKWLPGSAGGPAAGDFVEHPAGLPRYVIVAAGIVKGDGSSRFPVYNGLIAKASGPGRWTVMFNSYGDPKHPPEQPDYIYIVKALPVFNDQFMSLAVTFAGFQGGIILDIRNAGAAIPVEKLATMELVIEVSQYYVKAGLGPPPLIDLNTATIDELRTLPRIGPALAERIVSARSQAGGFSSVQDLLNVQGIGTDLLNNIQPLVTVGPRR